MNRSSRIKKSIGEHVFDTFNVVLMILLCFTTIYPFLYLLSLSLSSGNISLTKIHLFPPEFSLANYESVLSYGYIKTGFMNSIMRVVLGTALELFFCLLVAYPLAKRYLPLRNFWTGIIVFTMFFSGGLIPSYILMRELHLMNSIWALVLPNLIPAFSMILIRNYIMSLPDSIEESAKIDGAGEFTILYKIIAPMITPILATVALWSIVGHWNAWFDSLLYSTSPEKQVLQVVMRNIIQQGDVTLEAGATSTVLSDSVNPTTIKAATIMITSLPVIAIYPFLQKYFVKGIMVGSLKG